MSGDGILKMWHERNTNATELRFQLDKKSQWWFQIGVYEKCADCGRYTPQILDFRTNNLACERCGNNTRIPSIEEMKRMQKTWADYWRVED